MGLMDSAKDAVNAIGGDKVKDGIDSATDMIDDKTGGASNVVTEKVDELAAAEVDKLEGCPAYGALLRRRPIADQDRCATTGHRSCAVRMI